jgi:hypothetical protein
LRRSSIKGRRKAPREGHNNHEVAQNGASCQSGEMNTQVVPLQVDGEEMLFAVVSLAGSEQTSGVDHVRDKAADAMERAREAILRVAKSMVATIGELRRQATSPEHVQVEFGLAFTAKGDVIVISTAVEASLKVVLTYPVKGNTGSS